MRATVMFGAGDVHIETVPDARLIEPTDALVVVTRAAICGSDLWPYKTMEYSETGRRMGHEAIGVVEAVGGESTACASAISLSCRSHTPTAPVSSAAKVCTRRASTEGSLARLISPEHRPKRCVSPGQMEHSSSYRSAPTTH